jgi:ABC-2 type transport system permease protein
VALDIIKPVRYQEARFFDTLGGVWIEVLVVLIVGAATLLFGGTPAWPPGPELALFAASMLLLIPLKFLLVYSVGLLCFWTQNYMGLQWARSAVMNLLSGALVPLAFLPHWLGAVATWSPFAGVASTPALILIGRASGGHALALVATQAGWVVALWFGAKLLWRTAVRQLTVNGG